MGAWSPVATSATGLPALFSYRPGDPVVRRELLQRREDSSSALAAEA